MKQLSGIFATGILFLYCQSSFASDSVSLKVKAGQSQEHKEIAVKRDLLRIDWGGEIQVNISDAAHEVVVTVSAGVDESQVNIRSIEDSLEIEHMRGSKPSIIITIPRRSFSRIEIQTDHNLQNFGGDESITVDRHGEIYLTDTHGNTRSVDSTVNISPNANASGNFVTNNSSLTVVSPNSHVYDNEVSGGSSITIMTGASLDDYFMSPMFGGFFNKKKK